MRVTRDDTGKQLKSGAGKTLYTERNFFGGKHNKYYENKDKT